jgi:hypothetical protein
VHAIPKTVTFEVEVERDGVATVVEMVGYCRDRCPVWVAIEVEAARDAYLEAAYQQIETTDADGTVQTTSSYVYDRATESRYRRDVLVAVIKGLQDEEADVLIGSGDGIEMLQDLDWFSRRETVEEPADPEAEREEIAEVSTTAPSSRGSRRSTERTTG